MKVIDNNQAQFVNGASKESATTVSRIDWTQILNPPIALPEPVSPAQSATF